MKTPTRLLLAVLLAPLPAGAAAAQQQGPVVGQLLPYLGDTKLQRELNLTAEQARTLLSHRQQGWDEQLNFPPAELAAGATARAIDTRAAFRKALSPQQYDRAEQLGTRLALRRLDRRPIDPTRVEVRHLVAFPDVRAALALTADQRAVIDASRSLGVVFLLPPQTAALEALLGPPADVSWELEYDSRERPGAAEARVLVYLRGLTAAPDVRADLKLTAEQVRAMDALRAVPPGGAGGFRFPTPEERASQEEQAWKVLTPAQQVRFRQILARHNRGLSYPDDLTRPEVRGELALTADQERVLATIRTTFADAVAGTALSGDPAEAVGGAVRDATAARDRAFAAALTADQRAKVAARLGEPFAGRVEFDSGIGEKVKTRRRVRFGRYADELTVLTLNPAVQDELKLTPERLKLVRDANRQVARVPFEPTDEEAEARSEHVGKALAALLTAGQQRRLRQIMLQEIERPPAGRLSTLDIPSAVVYPGVAESVGLTDPQRASLIDGEHPLDVLTPRQQTMIRGMLGEPYRGRFGTSLEVSRTRTPGPRGTVLTQLTWSAVPLTPVQATTVARALNTFQVALTRPTTTRPAFGKGQPPAEPPTPADVLEKAVTDALTAEQVRRLDQLALQHAVGRDPRATLTGSDGTPLALTREQVERLFAIEQEWRKVVRVVLPAPLTRDRRLDLSDRLRRRLDEQLLPVLTPEQRATWSGLTGEPCADVPRPMPMIPPAR